MTHVPVLRYWRNWWGIKCWLRWCGGHVDYRYDEIFWVCEDCGKVTR